MASGKGKGFIRKSSINMIKVIDTKDEKSEEISNMIKCIFEGNEQSHLPTDLSGVSDYIEVTLSDLASQCLEEKTDDGCLGPSVVEFNTVGNFGTLIVEADRLGVCSQSNFSTIRANSCVYKGKWIYELMLGSKGVMQVGWCTANCKFSQEDGVGDTYDSFAFDGSRIQKWNMKMHSKYGQAWLTGDIISCAIDCDAGKVSFMRNGVKLGDAFEDVRLGPGFAYFPAVSLSQSENLRANFGSTPIRYPVDGFRPLQRPPKLDLIKAHYLLSCLDRVVGLLCNSQTTKSCDDLERSSKTTLFILAAQFVSHLGPLLANGYIVEDCLLNYLLEKRGDERLCLQLLDVLFALLQDHEMKHFMDNMIISLLSNYRFSPILPDFMLQKKYLLLLQNLLSHEKTRKYLLRNVLFDKVKFPIFFHLKPPDDEVLALQIPDVWYRMKPIDQDDRNVGAEENLDDESRAQDKILKEKYELACRQLREKVSEIEAIQIRILRLLLTDVDNTGQDKISTRLIFQLKFRDFLKENVAPSHIRHHQLNHCPPLVQLCFFNRLVRAVQHHWSMQIDNPNPDIYVPNEKFYNDSIKYFDNQRVGGLLSHLKKTYSAEIKSVVVEKPATDDDEKDDLQSIAVYSDAVLEHLEDCEDASFPFAELLDGLIMLYHTAAHKQLGKMCSVNETAIEYVTALVDAEKKLKSCPPELDEVRTELETARDVFLGKAVEQARHLAWIVSVVYSADKQQDVYWLMSVILTTLERASQQGKLFAFVPVFYVESCINSYTALLTYFEKIVSYNSLPGHREMLTRYAAFLTNSFCDGCIVDADLKDILIQSMACFVCYPTSLQALEQMHEEQRVQMVKALLAPYENRSWAQTNWILVRLWKGCGFAYRYTHPPHLSPQKSQNQEAGAAGLQKPCPSVVFQEVVRTVLQSDLDGSTKFLDSLLTQLNWAFSEFVSMLQELHQLVIQPNILLVDSRRLKICATCFDISIGLLRVLEMIIYLCPELFTDWSKPNSELLLCRLFQLVTQVLNRVTCKSNIFDIVVISSVPGLDVVDHFPILTPITGILVQLLVKREGTIRERALSVLLAEPGFQLNSIEYLMGENEPNGASSSGEKLFSLAEYREVSPEEEHEVDQLITLLRSQMQQSHPQDIEEDRLCSICYAQVKCVQFQPCGHQSCRSCITQHMMSKNECFFCKAKITQVVNIVDKKD